VAKKINSTENLLNKPFSGEFAAFQAAVK